jgi:hypothetical protein
LPEYLIDFLGGSGGVAKGSNVVSKGFGREVAVNGGKFIKFALGRTELAYLDHLSELLVANEGLVYFEDGLLEHKIDRIL